jgi:hypothetical protein
MWAWNELPLNIYISMYARTNRFYNERDSRTSYVLSNIPHLYYCTTGLLPFKSGFQSVPHEAKKTPQNFL